MAPTALQALRFTRGLRRYVRHPVTRAEAEATVTHELATRDRRFLASLDRLVWPFPQSPTRRLMDVAGVERSDVERLVADHGLEDALATLRDAGVYVAYEEYQGTVPARRGSTTLDFKPADFFNPVTKADFMASTGGSRSGGTPMELSFEYQRRQAVVRRVQYEMYGVSGAPTAVWLPVFPSSAGFGAVLKVSAGGNPVERWFSQIANTNDGVTAHKQRFNQAMPLLNSLARAGLPRPEHVPSSRADIVADFLTAAVRRAGRAAITGYASSLTAAARYAIDNGIDLTGVVCFPASEPVTAAKLDVIRRSGMRPCPMYAFVPEGAIALSCEHIPDEEYHLWDHELAAITRRRERDDGVDVDAFLFTSLPIEAPRVIFNVENDDYGTATRDAAPCECAIGAIGVRTRLGAIRGMSKVAAAGISLPGEMFDQLVEEVLPAAVGGAPGDFQFVEDDRDGATVVSIRVHPRVGAIDEQAAVDAVLRTLRTTDNGVLAAEVWRPSGGLRVERGAPIVTRAGKILAYERLHAPAAAPASRKAQG